MPLRHPLVLTAIAMLAFAANSVLCRLALHDGAIDAASFTAVRLVTGALTLVLILGIRQSTWPRPLAHGNHRSALALFVYAAGFSLVAFRSPLMKASLLSDPFIPFTQTILSSNVFTGSLFGPASNITMAMISGVIPDPDGNCIGPFVVSALFLAPTMMFRFMCPTDSQSK